MVPKITAVLELPQMLDDSREVERAYTRVAKAAVRKYMEKHHHKKVIPEHFKQTNRAKYDHFPRAASTKARKARQYRSRTDLVKTGRSANVFRNRYRRLRVGGKFSRGGKPTIAATLMYRFPFPVSAGRAASQSGVNPFKMALEVEAWTGDEVRKANDMIGDDMVTGLQREIDTRPRVRRKIGGLI